MTPHEREQMDVLLTATFALVVLLILLAWYF
jgi:hypothetical protein